MEAKLGSPVNKMEGSGLPWAHAPPDPQSNGREGTEERYSKERCALGNHFLECSRTRCSSSLKAVECRGWALMNRW